VSSDGCGGAHARFTVEGSRSTASSLASSAVIMPVSTSQSLHLPPPPRPEFPPVPEAYAHVPLHRSMAPSPESAPASASSDDNDDAVSVHSSTSSYIDVEEFDTTSSSAAPTVSEDVREDRDEFDFVDEDEENLTADEL